MDLPKRFIKQLALCKVKKEGKHKKPGAVWLMWAPTHEGSTDCFWAIKISKDSFRFFETAEAAEAYFALSGTEKANDSWKVNESFGLNVIRPQSAVRTFIA